MPRQGKMMHYQTIFGNDPPSGYWLGTDPIMMGNRIRFHADGRIIGIRYYRDQSSDGANVGFVLTAPTGGVVLRSVAFPVREAGYGPDGGAWENAYFHPMLRVEEDDELFVGVHYGSGRYWRSDSALASAPVISEDLEAIQDGDGGSNGCYDYGLGWDLPNTFDSTLYGTDVIFLSDVDA
jgi:Domain of unknown function (DUF4082)